MQSAETAAPRSRGRALVRPIAWAIALATCATLLACSDSNSVNVQTFTVSLTDTLHTIVEEDGTTVSTVLMVVDTDAGHVIGVSLNYAVSAGTLSSATGISGANGAASVVWTVTPAQAAASGQTDLIFSACADSDEPASCAPAALASLHVGG